MSMKKVKNLINWFKKLKHIVDTYDQDMEYAHARISHAKDVANESVQIIKERTTINADISPSARDPSQIITIGRYKGRDYVQVFSIHGDDFEGLIHRLRDMERYGTVRRIDAPYGFEMVLDQELGHHMR